MFRDEFLDKLNHNIKEILIHNIREIQGSDGIQYIDEDKQLPDYYTKAFKPLVEPISVTITPTKVNRNMLSFAFFDDLEEIVRFDVPINGLNKSSIKVGLDTIRNKVIDGNYRTRCWYKGYKWCENYVTDPSYNESDVLDKLMDNDYYVVISFEKYYAVAYAINYKRFYIYSKDQEIKVID